MSITVAISVDTSRVRLLLDKLLEDAVGNIEEGMLQVADDAIIPELYSASTTVWNIRTGAYSSSWYSQIIGKGVVRVGNDIDYAAPLEWGWTLRNGNFKESPGVLFPTVYGEIETFASELLLWIQEQIVA